MRAIAWSLVGLVFVVGTTATVAAKRSKRSKKGKHGKVVRVERSRLEGARVPRLCGQPQPDGQGGAYVQCSGPPILEGELGSVVTENGQIATLAVRTAQPTLDGCGNTTGWSLNLDIRQGSLDQLTWQTYLLFDWKTSTRSRTLANASMIPAPGQRAGEQIWAGIDDDGDDQPELMVSWFACDGAGQPSPYGQGGANCYVYYKRDGASYQEARVDVIKMCY